MPFRSIAALFLAAAAASPLAAGGATIVTVAKPSWCGAEAFDPHAVVEALNELRRAQGLQSVVADGALAAAAQAHSDDLAAWGRLSHQGSDGASFVVRTSRARYTGVPRAENVAWNLPTAATVVKAWDRSPGHQENMLLPDITHVGIGFACSPRNGRFWTMVLGRSETGVQYAALD